MNGRICHGESDSGYPSLTRHVESSILLSCSNKCSVNRMRSVRGTSESSQARATVRSKEYPPETNTLSLTESILRPLPRDIDL